MTGSRRRGLATALLVAACHPGAASTPASILDEAPPEAPANMIELDGGSFTMGRDDGKRDERPAHRVTLSPFAIDETLVTVAAFRAFVDDTGHRTSAERLGFGMTAFEGMDDWQWKRVDAASWRAPWGDDPDAPRPADDEPVVMVSWVDADAYCRHYGKSLPTEAQWEYAMRAGAEGTRFPWGDDPHRPDGTLGLNYWQGRTHRADPREDGFLYVSPVRAFAPNDWGIYDPVGNVWQWVADWYGAQTYAHDAAGAIDPEGPDTGWARVARGGSWWCSANACSAYGLHARGKSRPHAPFANIGFRCVRNGASR